MYTISINVSNNINPKRLQRYNKRLNVNIIKHDYLSGEHETITNAFSFLNYSVMEYSFNRAARQLRKIKKEEN